MRWCSSCEPSPSVIPSTRRWCTKAECRRCLHAPVSGVRGGHRRPRRRSRVPPARRRRSATRVDGMLAETGCMHQGDRGPSHVRRALGTEVGVARRLRGALTSAAAAMAPEAGTLARQRAAPPVPRRVPRSPVRGFSDKHVKVRRLPIELDRVESSPRAHPDVIAAWWSTIATTLAARRLRRRCRRGPSRADPPSRLPRRAAARVRDAAAYVRCAR